jgi:hypothetical protein
MGGSSFEWLWWRNTAAHQNDTLTEFFFPTFTVNYSPQCTYKPRFISEGKRDSAVINEIKLKSSILWNC